MKHLKLFESQAQYESWKSGEDFVLPNVSYCEDGNLYYTPAESGLVYNMVDLGLPSGLLWADRNVGAASPEDAGLYFQYGDTIGYTAEQIGVDKTFNVAINHFGVNSVLDPEEDAAVANMGYDWRMPTGTEIKELYNNTTKVFITVDDEEYNASTLQKYVKLKSNELKGVKYIGPNGNSIFFPAGGWAEGSTLTMLMGGFMIPSSTTSSKTSTEMNMIYGNYGGYQGNSTKSKAYGYSVRGVCNK